MLSIFKSKENFSLIFPLIFIGLVLYLQNAWVPGFFQDGYLYSAFARSAAEDGNWLIPHLAPNLYDKFDQHVPLAFILQGVFFKIFGPSYVSGRIFSTIFTLGTFFILVSWIFKIDKKWAFFTGLIFLLIPSLIKKTRFPGMDTPLMFFIFTSLFFYFKALTQKKRNWIYCGLFFGLAMLVKGPMAILVPFGIFCHLLVTKDLKRLLSPIPWGGLFLGLILFSIWPLSLYLKGEFGVFTHYLDFTFLHTIKDGRGGSSSFFTYFLFLLKQTPLWFLLFGLTLFKFSKKEYKSKELTFAITIFSSSLILLSCMKFKYSHYLISLFPFYAMACAYPLSKMGTKSFEKVHYSIKALGIALPLVFLILPITNHVRRDKEIFKTLEFVRSLEKRPNAWAVIDGAYPYFALANLLAYEEKAEAYEINSSMLKDLLKEKKLSYKDPNHRQYSLENKNWVLLLSQKSLASLSGLDKELLERHFKKLLLFKKKSLLIFVQRKLVGSNLVFQID